MSFLGRKPTIFSVSATKLDATDGQPKFADDVADILRMAQHRGGMQTLPRRKRENAAKVLWKAGMRSISTRVWSFSVILKYFYS